MESKAQELEAAREEYPQSANKEGWLAPSV